METSIELSTLLAIAGAITAVGTAWLTIRKINADFKKERAIEKAAIIQEAKEEDSKIKLAFETSRALIYAEIVNRLEDNEHDLEMYKKYVEKELGHLRETYNGELRNLGMKIEDLRAELRDQHGQLLELLTNMIKPRN